MTLFADPTPPAPLDPDAPDLSDALDDARADAEPVRVSHRIIRASAGSGKTFQLAHRYLGLLRAGARPEAVLATTFTRKAAGEIRTRVLTLLAQAATDQEAAAATDANAIAAGLPAQALQAADADADAGGNGRGGNAYARLLLSVLERLDTLQITTLDGFFYRVANGFQIELGLPAEPVLITGDDAAAARLRTLAVDGLLDADAAAGDGDALRALHRLLRGTPGVETASSVFRGIGRVVGGTGGLYEVFRDVPDRHRWRSLQDLAGLDKPLSKAELKRLVLDWQKLAPELPTTKTGKTNSYWDKAFARVTAALDELLDAPRRMAWLDLLNDKFARDCAREETFGKAPVPEAFRDIAEPMLRHAAAAVLEELDRQTASTWSLLDRFDRRFQAAGRARGVLQFSDLTLTLLRALRGQDDTEQQGDDAAGGGFASVFAEQLAYRLGPVEHLLLDEFQDTSVAQYEVLKPLIDELVLDETQGRSLFVVGDPKQSIYGWRGGRRELFDRVVREVPEEHREVVPLSRSYRSSQTVLDSVNRVFADLPDRNVLDKNAAAAEDFADGFETHSPAGHAARLTGYVRLEEVEPVEEEPDAATDMSYGVASPTPADGPDAESPPDHPSLDRAADLAADAFQRLRPRGLTVAVLVRTNADGLAVLHRLRRLDVPVELEGGSCPADHPAASAVLAALRLADHPADTAAAFELWQSPLSAHVGLKGLSSFERERWAERTRNTIVARGLPAVIGQWARSLAEPVTDDQDQPVAPPPLDAEGWRRLTELQALAEDVPMGHPLRPAAFVRHARTVSIPEAAAASSVAVMTVHKAKGLEFDCVVLPLPKRERAFSPTTLDQRADPAGGIDAVYRAPQKHLAELVPALGELRDAAEVREAYEGLCRLYVAMTRAKRELLMVCPQGRGKRKKPKANESPWSAGSLAVVASAFDAEQPIGERDSQRPGVRVPVWFEDGTEDWWRPEPVQDAAPAAAATTTTTTGWPLDPGVGRVPRILTETGTGTDGRRTVRGADLFDDRQRRAMDSGTVTHRLCEAVGFVDEDPPTREDLLAAVPGQPELADRLLGQLQAPALREALSRRGAADRWCERRFARLDEQGHMIRGVIDRVVWWTDASGKPQRAEVLDFKTDAVSAADALAQSLGYRDQLTLYRDAAASLLHLPPTQVTASLAWLECGTLTHLDDIPTV